MLYSTLTGILLFFATSSNAVTVQVMSESLCIDCYHFYEEEFVPAYWSLQGETGIQWEIVPFGNSKLSHENRTVTCQHGPAECDANSWQQCAVELLPQKNVVSFMDCLEKALPMGYRERLFDASVFETCLESDQFPVNHGFHVLQVCHDDPKMAWHLQVKYANMTPPEHTSVPWVIINGVHVEETDLLKKICDALEKEGSLLPGACSSVSGIAGKVKEVASLRGKQ